MIAEPASRTENSLHTGLMPGYLKRPLLACCMLFIGGFGLFAQVSVGEDQPAEITRVLQRQAGDWNRGDLDAFASGYKNSPDILFIGSHVAHGFAAMLAGYKAHYPTRESMGTLRFDELAVQPLDKQFATATGNFHLTRTAAGGGDVGGYFLLVLEKTPAGWKIVRDDTTVPPHGK